ncbi:MAG: FHA domain-containing protein [Ruminococcus sp.]|nr:FHA domain-containing protein [Ruminococcus sp.]
MPEILSELWQMLSGLQVPDLVLSAVAVVILDMFAISVILAVGRESRLCQKRWQKVSAGLELRRRKLKSEYDDKKEDEDRKEIHYPLEADEILLGRHSSADIQIKDPSVSRYHAVMTVTGGVWTITDLNARCGTFVNEHRIRQKKLAPGDCIRLGNAKLYLAKRPVTEPEE